MRWVRNAKTMNDTKIIKSFGILYRTFLSYMSKSIKNLEIAYSDSVFLVNIGDEYGISQEEMSANLSIDKAAIARSVKRMVQKGYVAYKSSQADKRIKRLYLTEQGEKIYEEILKLNAKWLDSVMEDISVDKRDDFQEIITSLCKKAANFGREQ